MCRECSVKNRVHPWSVLARDAFYQRITEQGAVLLEPEWLGTKTPHHCRCTNGHDCWPLPNGVQQGQGVCRVCGRERKDRARSAQAWKDFQGRIADQGGEVLEAAWLGSNVAHRCRCAKGHECRPRPADIRDGNGMCQTCAGRDSAAAWGAFRQQVAEQGGEVLEPEWLGSNKPHRCRCLKGHECWPTPSSIQGGNGMCRACAGRDPANAWKAFHGCITGQGGVVLESKWLGSNVPHRCRCVNGHECWPRPAGVLYNGQGMCIECGYALRINPLSQPAWANFRRRVAEQGGEVLEPKWLGADTPHRCRCSKGHECWPRPTGVHSGQGICRVCGWHGQDVLYVVRNPAASSVKFGITNKDGQVRLGYHGRAGYTEVLHLITGLPEGLAALTEQRIKLALAMVDAKPVQGYEYFSDEYLGLIENEIVQWVPSQIAPMVQEILAPKYSIPL
jgi:hypothetical protein